MQIVVAHHQTAAIPVDQLQAIRLAGSEYEDRPRKWVLMQLVLDQRAKPS